MGIHQVYGIKGVEKSKGEWLSWLIPWNVLHEERCGEIAKATDTVGGGQEDKNLGNAYYIV